MNKNETDILWSAELQISIRSDSRKRTLFPDEMHEVGLGVRWGVVKKDGASVHVPGSWSLTVTGAKLGLDVRYHIKHRFQGGKSKTVFFKSKEGIKRIRKLVKSD